LEKAFEVGWFGVGDEGGGAPVMEEGVGRGRSGEVFDEELAGAEVAEGGGVGGEREEGVGRVVLLGEAGFDLGSVGVEGGDRGGGWLGEEARCGEEKGRAGEENELADEVARRVHGDKREV
jgi:hypothetical protein